MIKFLLTVGILFATSASIANAEDFLGNSTAETCLSAGFKSKRAVKQCIQSQAHPQLIISCSLLDFNNDVALNSCIQTQADNSAVALCRQFTYEAPLAIKVKCAQTCAVMKYKESVECMRNL